MPKKRSSKKICRNSSRTFISGCRCPHSGGTPEAVKLYALKGAVFHDPQTGAHRQVSVLSFSRGFLPEMRVKV